MRLISFDVGIKNLAYCVFSVDDDNVSSTKKWSIPEWNCANLLALDSIETSARVCCHVIKGKKKSDESHKCNKTAKWMVPTNNDESYCEVHAKIHTEWIIPKSKHTLSHIKKQKVAELKTEYERIFAVTNSMEPSSPSTQGRPDLVRIPSSSSNPGQFTTTNMNKSELIDRIETYYKLNCFQSTTANQIKSKNAGEVDLVTIGRAIKRQLDDDKSISGITHVIIENQISTIASRMKTIQGMIAQYFIMRFGNDVAIEFVSSHNKLKGFSLEKKEKVQDTSKTSYKEHKMDGVAICRKFFDANTEMSEWLSVFDRSKKRDDLADCFLQGVWYLKSNKILYYAEDLKINSVFVS